MRDPLQRASYGVVLLLEAFHGDMEAGSRDRVHLCHCSTADLAGRGRSG